MPDFRCNKCQDYGVWAVYEGGYALECSHFSTPKLFFLRPRKDVTHVIALDGKVRPYDEWLEEKQREIRCKKCDNTGFTKIQRKTGKMCSHFVTQPDLPLREPEEKVLYYLPYVGLVIQPQPTIPIREWRRKYGGLIAA